MDLVVIAQIITGSATLIVALVLVFQLKQQTNQLKLQHKDFAQQIKNQIGDRRTSATLNLNPDNKFFLNACEVSYSTVYTSTLETMHNDKFTIIPFKDFYCIFKVFNSSRIII